MKYSCRYDIDGFANELKLPIEDLADLYTELINEINSEISIIKEAYIIKDYNAIKRILHNLIGFCSNYRIIDIYEESAKLNKLLKTEIYDNLDELLSNLYVISENAVSEITDYFNQKQITL